MPRKPSEAKSYLPTEGGGAAPAPVKRKRSVSRAKVAVKPQSVDETAPIPAAAGELEQAFPTVSDASLDPAKEREEIARLAYLLWEARGGQGGSAEEDWLRAEREVMRRRAALS